MDFLCLYLYRTRFDGIHTDRLFLTDIMADDDGIHQFLQYQKLIASLIGIMIPYWFSAGYYAYTNNIDGLVSHFTEFINYHELFDYSRVTDHEVVNLIFITILGIIGSIHFLHTAYADKIRTRMIYESFTMVNFVSLAFIILQPQHIKELGQHHDSKHGTTHRSLHHLYQGKNNQYHVYHDARDDCLDIIIQYIHS